MLAKIRVFIFVLFMILLSSESLIAVTPKPQLIVVPARQTLIKFSLDIAEIRDVYIVSYSQGLNLSQPLMHVWNKNTKEWVRISIDEYESGGIFKDIPKLVFIIDGNDRLFPILKDASSWCDEVKHIQRLDLVTLVNTLNESLYFNAREWKKLARRNGLELTDRNAERRRYGRYGKPGSGKKHKRSEHLRGAKDEADTPLSPLLPAVIKDMEPDSADIQETPEGLDIKGILPEDK